MDNRKKLALGTAQFGLNYGISNSSGKVHRREVERILKVARDLGIDTIDTAAAYGKSEVVLGSLLNNFKVFSKYTKIRALPYGMINVEKWIFNEVYDSIERLNCSNIAGVLLHDANQLLSPNGKEIYRTLNILKSKGVFKHIGVSVYYPSDLEILLKNFNFDIVQFPFSIVDRRFLKNGLMRRLNKMGVIIHTRSVFLQGLLLMQLDTRPEKFSIWKEFWGQWHQWLEKTGQTALEGSLQYALSFKEIDRVIVGVENERQLMEIANASVGNIKNTPENFFIDDERLLIPSNWNNL